MYLSVVNACFPSSNYPGGSGFIVVSDKPPCSCVVVISESTHVIVRSFMRGPASCICYSSIIRLTCADSRRLSYIYPMSTGACFNQPSRRFFGNSVPRTHTRLEIAHTGHHTIHSRLYACQPKGTFWSDKCQHNLQKKNPFSTDFFHVFRN